jgi:hypothetical protein
MFVCLKASENRKQCVIVHICVPKEKVVRDLFSVLFHCNEEIRAF